MEMTVKQAALKWGITTRQVQLYCVQKRISGARRVGRMWMMPSDAVKPDDARRSDAIHGCPYWPEILVLNTDFMYLSDADSMLAETKDPVRQRQLRCEIAYMKGDYRAAMSALEGLDQDSPAYLSALMIVGAAAAGAGDTKAFISMQVALEQLKEQQGSSGVSLLLIELVQGLLAVSSFALQNLAPWLLTGDLAILPRPARAMAIFVRIKALLIGGEIERALGTLEATLCLLPEKNGFLCAYLHILLAQVCIYNKVPARARCALETALRLFLPLEFFSPLAENVALLLGLLEQCMGDTHPEQLSKIIALHQKIADAWRKLHNQLTHGQLTTLLTRREYQVAICAAVGLNAKLSAGQIGISVSTYKGYLQTVYQKLGVKNRKSLKAYILP